MEFQTIVADFARGLTLPDSRRPRSKRWQPGIGQHDEPDIIKMVFSELRSAEPQRYRAVELEVRYPESSERCHVCLGSPGDVEWAIEIKPLRMLGDKGIVIQGRDDVSRILSPYPAQRSALTDCIKLVDSRLRRRRAILTYAYDPPEYPMSSLVDEFELLAEQSVRLRERARAPFEGLIHPVHQRGAVFAWELLSRR